MKEQDGMNNGAKQNETLRSERIFDGTPLRLWEPMRSEDVKTNLVPGRRFNRYVFTRHPAAEERRRSAIRLAKFILQPAPDILPEHRKQCLDVVMWKLTEAESANKYRTRFCSQAMYENPEPKPAHDHVYPRALMAERLVAAAPNEVEVEAILRKAVGCTVTRAEHRKLSERLYGWERYRRAGIIVIDSTTGKVFDGEEDQEPEPQVWHGSILGLATPLVPPDFRASRKSQINWETCRVLLDSVLTPTTQRRSGKPTQKTILWLALEDLRGKQPQLPQIVAQCKDRHYECDVPIEESVKYHLWNFHADYYVTIDNGPEPHLEAAQQCPNVFL